MGTRRRVAIGGAGLLIAAGAAVAWVLVDGEDPIVVATCPDPTDDLDGFGDLAVLDRLPLADLTDFQLARQGDRFTATFTIAEALGELEGIEVTALTEQQELPLPTGPDGEESSLGWGASVSDGSGPGLHLSVSIDLLGPDGPVGEATATVQEGDNPAIGLAGAHTRLAGRQVEISVDAPDAFLGDAVTSLVHAVRFYGVDPAAERELTDPSVTRADDYCELAEPEDAEPEEAEPDPIELVLGEDLSLHFDGRGMSLNTLGAPFQPIVEELTTYFGADPDLVEDGPCTFPASGPMVHVRWGELHLFGAQGMWVGWVLSTADDPGPAVPEPITGAGLELLESRQAAVELGVEFDEAEPGFEVGTTIDGTVVVVDTTVPDGAIVGLAGGVPCGADGYRFEFDDAGS